MMNFGLNGKVIAVAGGASGIGRAVVNLALENSCLVAILDSNEGALDAAVTEISTGGGQVKGYHLDVRDATAVKQAVDAIERDVGPIYGLVNSAGISRPHLAENLSVTDWESVLDVNLKGSFLLAQEAGRHMLARRNGAIVLVSSVDGFGGHAARSHYTASKFGCIGLAKSLAIEWGRHGVRVNAIAPGIVDTPLLRANIAAAHIEGVMLDRVPMARLSSGLDQARATLFLLSEAASYITGIALPVDGGLTAGYFTHRHGEDSGK
jgi:NAD(P)-dependent dehydrogenase (short-subunit alcohol dehydrogenase family)